MDGQRRQLDMANEKFKNACERIPQKTPPVWMMRQAGRYHQHYQALRKEHSFMELCKQPKLAAEVALGPVAEFDFDVSILFSDLLFPLEALGLGLKYDPAPELDWHLLERSDFDKMRPVDEAFEYLKFQGEAVTETRKVLPDNKSLIGFVGSPWTLFVYAVAGSHKGNLIEVKKRMNLFPIFCEMIAPLMEKNIELQLNAGAEKVMVFDTAAGELWAEDFIEHLHLYLIGLSSKFPGQLGYYSKNTNHYHLSDLWDKSQFAGFGYDHRWCLNQQFKKGKGFVQGNFDQSMLFLPQNEFETYLRGYLETFTEMSESARAGWVCGLGHGVLPKTPEVNVKRFVEIVRETF